MKNNKNKNYIVPQKTINQLEIAFLREFKIFRRENNLTQQLLADYTGYTREKISRIESGINSPSLKTLLKILGPLGYTLKIEKIKNKEKNKNILF